MSHSARRGRYPAELLIAPENSSNQQTRMTSTPVVATNSPFHLNTKTNQRPPPHWAHVPSLTPPGTARPRSPHSVSCTHLIRNSGVGTAQHIGAAVHASSSPTRRVCCRALLMLGGCRGRVFRLEPKPPVSVGQAPGVGVGVGHGVCSIVNGAGVVLGCCWRRCSGLGGRFCKRCGYARMNCHRQR